ncbi:MAG: UDP-glucose 4-epimerase GalE [Pirellulaceae bacterium]|nr:UDP-glucose 4-epimerase GalE [Pirellulaceae bacterium]
MKILITGGAGYIGSITAEKCLLAGHEVIVFDNLSQGHQAAVPADATLIEGDLANGSAIDTALAENPVDAVMHFASRTLVGESMDQPFLYLGDNVTNGLNLLQAVIRQGVKRFILSSTANLFDEPERIPITESEKIVPGSPYGESKYILERMLAWLDRTCGLKYAALRYFNAAGATASRGEDHSPETHLVPLVLQVALGKRESITVFGNDYPTPDGSCVRDYVHIADLAQAHLLALEALDKGSQIYNLGNGDGYSVLEVIETARQVTGHDIPTTIGPRRAGDPPTLVAGSDKICNELGWQPMFPGLREIVESAWHWHQQYPRGYDD